MFIFFKKVYIMMKHVMDKLPIHGYIKTRTVQITEGKSIIERAVLVERHHYSSSSMNRSVSVSGCKKGASDCFVKEHKKR